MRKLFVTDGPMKGKSFPLRDGTTRIGRAPDNDICIAENGVSPHHAKLLKKDDQILITGLGGPQELVVDGQKAKPGLWVEITTHSKISLGRTMLSLQDAEMKSIDEEPVTESTRKYIRSLEVLLEVSNLFAETRNIDELLAVVMDQVFNLLNTIDGVAILLLDKQTGKLLEVASKNRTEDGEGFFSEIRYSRTIVERTLKDGEPVVMSDMHNGDRIELSDSMQRMNVRSVMCVPLRYKGDVRGVIYVDAITSSEGFRGDDLQVLTALSDAAAIAIENARLHENVRQELAEQVRAEKALREARRDLEEQVKKRTAELSNTIDFLKQEIAEHMRAEDALRESEEKYRIAFEASRDAVFITNRDGKFLDVNRSFLDLFGFTRAEVTNLRAEELYVNAQERSRFQQEIDQKGVVRDFVARSRTKDGNEMQCLLTASVRRAGDRSIRGYQAIVRDITE